jgi:hypothetical protein
LSLDEYGRDLNQAYYDSLNALSGGKPMVLGEVGNPPSLEILEKQPRWSFWVIWAGMVRSTPRKEHHTLLQSPGMLAMEKQVYWDMAKAYHQAVGLASASEQWIMPPRFEAADFSGNWILDEDDSEFGRMGAGFAPYKLAITQNETDLIVEKTRLIEYDDDVVTCETYKLDGTETQSNSGFRGALRVSTAYWSA